MNFYLIQDMEDWGPGLKEILGATYKMPLKKIVVSKWLQNLLKSDFEETSVLIPNGFDFSKFYYTIPSDKKDKNSISMLYHEMIRKRSEDAIEAVKKVKDKVPELRVVAFGVPPRPKNLPDWIEYYQQPDDETHNRINNECAIYIASSEKEGWGLTVGEAMICGQAVCCTDNEGYKEMAIDQETALLSPIRDPESLAENIIRLIKDDELRIKIAEQGNQYIRNFTWEKSYEKFKILIESSIKSPYSASFNNFPNPLFTLPYFPKSPPLKRLAQPSICFLFPHPALGPTGGYKVVYEYANRFANDGYKVHIVYSGSIFWKQKPLKYKLSNIYRYCQTYFKGFSARKWFPLDKKVKEHLTFSLNYRHVPKADIYIATSPYTAWYSASYPTLLPS